MDVDGAVRWGKEMLGETSRRSEQCEAELLLEIAMGRKRFELLTRSREEVAGEAFSRYREFVLKRTEGAPLGYISGETEFMSLPFYVDSSVMVPRPETEILVQACIRALDEKKGGGGKPAPEIRVLDLCTGCANIAVSIAVYAGCRVFAADISADALGTAARNARLNGVEHLVDFARGDMFEPVRRRNLRKFDLIVSNPPYVRTGDIPGLPADVRGYEPVSALDGGKDGLDFYRVIAGESPAFLGEGGSLVLEVGYDQAAAAGALLRKSYASVERIKDYRGIERVLLCRGAG